MKKLYRSSNRILAGVCGGIAEYLNIDPTVVRVLYIVLSFFSAFFATKKECTPLCSEDSEPPL